MTHYEKLQQHFLKISNLNHLGAICGWDQAAMMPAGGNGARGPALAELAVLVHQRATAPQLADWFAAAADEARSEAQHASRMAMKRRWQQASVVPDDRVQAMSLASSRCEHAWRDQRKNN